MILLSLLLLVKKEIYKPKKDWIKFLASVTICSFTTAFLCYFFSSEIDWIELQNNKNKVNVNDEIYRYVIEIEETIKSLDQHIHVSARCLKQIIDLAKGWAVVHGKDYVTHQEVKDILPYIFRHRIKFLKQEDKFNYVNTEILSKISILK